MKRIFGVLALAAVLLAPKAAEARVRPGMLALGIGGSVGAVGGAVGAIYCFSMSAYENDLATIDSNSYQTSYYYYAHNGLYYSSYGKNELDSASGYQTAGYVFVGVAIVGTAAAVVGFVNMADRSGGYETPRERRKRRAREDDEGLVPLLDYSQGSLMVMAPDMNYDPAQKTMEARLLRAEF